MTPAARSGRGAPCRGCCRASWPELAVGEKKPPGEPAAEGAGDEAEAPAEGEAASADPKKAKGDGKDGEEEEESFGMGRTFSFKPFHLNLGNPLENHYVRLEVSVEYATPKAEKELARRKAQLRDAVVSIVSNKTAGVPSQSRW